MGKSALGLVINEFYGQTECNLVVGSCAAIGVSRPGVMGKAIPGHVVRVIGRTDAMPGGEIGEIAIKRHDPVMFLSYWGNPDATREKFIGDWMTTGDQGWWMTTATSPSWAATTTSSRRRLSHRSRRDRGLPHPPSRRGARRRRRQADPLRTEIVKAFVVLKPACRRPMRLRRNPGLRQAAPLGPRVSTPGRLHRRHADDDDRQGDTEAVAGAGVGFCPRKYPGINATSGRHLSVVPRHCKISSNALRPFPRIR